MAKSSPSDATIVKQAERRALITAFLNQHEGEHSVAEVAAATSLKPAAVGLTLKSMAENGLVSSPRREKGQNFYSSDAQPAKRAYVRRTKSTTTTAAAKDVELVVGGTMIIIGRSADTGRLRITLEDIA